MKSCCVYLFYLVDFIQTKIEKTRIYFFYKNGLHCRLNTLKIQDDGRPSRWIFKIAIYSLNCRKSNTEEIYQIYCEHRNEIGPDFLLTMLRGKNNQQP